MISYFKTRVNQPVRRGQSARIKKQFQGFQCQVAFGLLSGYAMFYLIRMSLSIAKKPLLDAGIVSLDEIGLMGTAFFMTYAAGKISNGFFSDYAHIPRFIAFSLFCSALLEMLMGFNASGIFFIVLFALNGWFQSVGSAPCCVALFNWFPPKQRGTGYALWGGMRNAGEAMAWVITSLVISSLGFSAAFIGSGFAALLSGLCVLFLLKDRPRTYGFPDPSTVYGEPVETEAHYHAKQTLKAQCFILKQPVLWLIALACGAMYMSRYSLSSWAALFLQEEKGYTLIDAGIAMSIIPLAAAIGAVLSGTLSDRWFNANRNLPTLFYGLINIAAFYLLFFVNTNRSIETCALFLSGFSLGGLLIFLAGLNACDLLPKNAVGAVKGFLGVFSYMAAALQEYISSQLIQVKSINEITTYDFSSAKYFWLSTCIISFVLTLFVFPFKRIDILQDENPTT